VTERAPATSRTSTPPRFDVVTMPRLDLGQLNDFARDQVQPRDS